MIGKYLKNNSSLLDGIQEYLKQPERLLTTTTNLYLFLPKTKTMNILEFDPKEHEETIDLMESVQDLEVLSDFKSSLENSYQSLLFLGKSILSSEDDNMLSIAIFNIRLLYVYYKRKEEYEKLAELKKLATMLESNSVKNIVEDSILKDINVNLN